MVRPNWQRGMQSLGCNLMQLEQTLARKFAPLRSTLCSPYHWLPAYIEGHHKAHHTDAKHDQEWQEPHQNGENHQTESSESNFEQIWTTPSTPTSSSKLFSLYPSKSWTGRRHPKQCGSSPGPEKVQKVQQSQRRKNWRKLKKVEESQGLVKAMLQDWRWKAEPWLVAGAAGTLSPCPKVEPCTQCAKVRKDDSRTSTCGLFTCKLVVYEATSLLWSKDIMTSCDKGSDTIESIENSNLRKAIFITMNPSSRVPHHYLSTVSQLTPHQLIP